MFAGSLLRSARNAAQTGSILHQQVRFKTKTYRLKSGDHGAKPLITNDDFEEAKEANLLEDLSYQEIRFPLPFENNSPLFDKEYERFCRYVMKGGRKDLAHDLMHRTFYNIKTIQYNKVKKLAEKQGQGNLVTLEFIEQMKSDPSRGTEETGHQKVIELDPLTIFKTALSNCEPLVITRKIKRGGATYQVPCPLGKEESQWFALKWMISAVLERPKPRKKPFEEVMAQELLDAFYERGKVIKKRDDLHRLADQNKAYAHYRWG